MNKTELINIYHRKDGENVLNDILNKALPVSEYTTLFPHHRIQFYFEDSSGKYVAVDNRSQDCFVEEFDNIDDALDWLEELES